MKKNGIVYLIIILISSLIIIGCTLSDGGLQLEGSNDLGVLEKDIEKEDGNEYEKMSVVTTLFPQYDFARIIAGEYADVKYLLPAGTEAHSYEPTPKDMVALLKADIFLYTGELMEPWTVNIVNNMKEENVLVVDLSENITLLTCEDHNHEAEDGNNKAYDPHYWTDPNMAIIMVDSIADAFIATDFANSDEYLKNANKLKEDLRSLDKKIRETISKTKSKTILSGGHFAFGYFAKQYGLDHLSPYTGFAPNAEPTPQSIKALIQAINTTKSKVIFHEELIDPKVAEVIAEETGVEMLLLHGVHNISKEELNSGKTYIDIMYENLENLKVGLGYEEQVN